MVGDSMKATAFERMILRVSPRWAVSRMRSRMVAETMFRHYEAAQRGRRTDGWRRSSADANVSAQSAVGVLRAHGRDLVRNNAWAKNALRILQRNIVGIGIRAKPVGAKSPTEVSGLWRRWAGTTQCDAAGRLPFSGIQSLVVRSVAEAGEVLIRKRRRLSSDGLAIPLQLQVIEADYLDTSKSIERGPTGGPIIAGVEFDAIDRRTAYWLFPKHPGSAVATPVSQRVPASDVLHIYDLERAGQARGVSWLSASVLNLKDFDEFEDAELMKAKIAACLSVFVTEVDGEPGGLGSPGTDAVTAEPVDTIGPGMVQRLLPGQDVTVVTPPPTTEGGFTTRQLRRIAAGIGVTYEELTGDYSQVNYSSARMARLAHWANVDHWRANMLGPQLLDPVWAWAMEAAEAAGGLEIAAGGELPTAEWTPPPMPMLDPNTEGLAYSRRVRSGVMTPSDAAREQGYDWEEFVAEYQRDQADLDAAGIVLDSDARRVTQFGMDQPVYAAASGKASEGGRAVAGLAGANSPSLPSATDVVFNRDADDRVIGATIIRNKG